MSNVKTRKLILKEVNQHSKVEHKLTAYISKMEGNEHIPAEFFTIFAGTKEDWKYETEQTLNEDDHPEVQRALVGSILKSIRTLEDDGPLMSGERLGMSQYVL